VLCQSTATEYTNAWTTFANVEKSWAYRQDQLPSTHPNAADNPPRAGGPGFVSVCQSRGFSRSS
uniref:hypothetical protein n=1 Tax=Nocardia abscessus TaxID=120957 RepID=UPI002456C3E1